MPIFVVWAFAASAMMFFVAFSAFLSPTGLSGDLSIAFTLYWLVGLPAWLIVAALSLMRWQKTPKSKTILYNIPAIIAVILYCIAQAR